MRRWSLLAAAIVAVAIVATACSGGGGGGGGDDDDDDVATSPTPTPVDGVDYCYVIWGTTAGGVATEYYLDFPVDVWTAGGEVAIDDVFNWAELAQIASGGDLVWSMVATGGTITTVTSAAGTDPGDALTIDDPSAQILTDYGRGLTGTAGAGSFSGVWSDPSSAASPIFSTEGKTLGTGTITVVAVSGTASAPVTIGASYAYAQCYDLQAIGRAPR